MKNILIVLTLLISFNSFAQGGRVKLNSGLERCKIGGVYVQDCWIHTDVNGKAAYITTAQAKAILGITSMNAFTSGSILFAHTDGTITQDNANLFYNNTSNKVGINKNNGLIGTLDVAGDLSFSLRLPDSGDDFLSVYDNLQTKSLSISLGDNYEWRFNNEYGVRTTPFKIDQDAGDNVLHLVNGNIKSDYYANSRNDEEIKLNDVFSDDTGTFKSQVTRGDVFPSNPYDGQEFYYAVDDFHELKGWYYYDEFRAHWLSREKYAIEFNADSLIYNGYYWCVPAHKLNAVMNINNIQKKLRVTAISTVTFTEVSYTFVNMTSSAKTISMFGGSLNDLDENTECTAQSGANLPNGSAKQGVCFDLNTDALSYGSMGIVFTPIVASTDVRSITVTYYYHIVGDVQF